MSRRKQPLREQSFRIGTIAVGLVLGFAVVFLVPALTGADSRLSGGALTTVIVIAVLVAIGAVALGLLIGRRIVGDRIEVAMRDSGRKWRHGRVTVTPGHLSFQPYWWQVRIPAGPAIEMDVNVMGEDTGRRPPLKQIWSVNPQLHIVDIEGSHGSWELAALPSRLTEMRERLANDGAGTRASTSA
jgi:hypothetical protein